jgi:uncharacterized membrane protein YkvI
LKGTLAMLTPILVVCIVIIVGGYITIRTNKTDIFCSIIGYILIGLQLLVFWNDSNTGREVDYFSNVQSLSQFIWDLSGFLAYNAILIIGIIFVIVGYKNKNKNTNDKDK